MGALVASPRQLPDGHRVLPRVAPPGVRVAGAPKPVFVFEIGAPVWFGLSRTRTLAFLYGVAMHVLIGLMFGPVVWFALLMITMLVGGYAPDGWFSGSIGSPSGWSGGRPRRTRPRTTRRTRAKRHDYADAGCILAGGLATRMRPRTLTIPKSMLEVAGRPFVDWQLERLAVVRLRRRRHVRRVPRRADLEDHVGDGARYGLRVRYSDEGPDAPRHGRGPPRRARAPRARRSSSPTATATCPSTTPSRCASLAAHDDCDGVMSVFKNDGAWDASNVSDRRHPGPPLREGDAGPARSTTSTTARTALRREVIAALPPESAGPRRAPAATRRGEALAGLVARSRFFEIGSPEGLAALDELLQS